MPGLARAALTSIGRFMDTMVELRAMADANLPVGELLEAVLQRSGYLDALEAERTFEARGRIENLEELVGVAREFDQGEQGTLDAFLAQVALTSDADTRVDDQGLVTLMTLHNAKGLEYPIVFILGCEEGIFPHSRSLDEGSLEEEQRLCYVGITRAMRSLTITYARRRTLFGAESYGLRSRFIDEIPAELTDRSADIRPSGLGMAAATVRVERWSSGDGDPGGARAVAQLPCQFRVGEDVVHAAFGDRVVTGVEPGGIVVVRFAGDGSERKLLAEHAPVSRR